MTTWPELLTSLVNDRDLTGDDARWAMQEILDGAATPIQVAAFAVALRAKGESVAEVRALADVMMEFARPVELTGHRVDVVGTGGDRANTVNVSTMASITAASLGARVAKHGNRAASSKCGTADVLEELGVVLDLAPEHQGRVLDEIGMVFLFAAHYHPALRHAAGPRRELGISTTFNYLGPLANPARPQAAAIGVADVRMAQLMAGVIADRGNQGLVFHGDDGLDELTTTTSSKVWLIRDGREVADTLDPRDLDIAPATVEDLVGGDPAVNARIARAVLGGEQQGAVHDIVALNAAAALLAWHGPELERPVTEQLGEHLATVREALAAGRPMDTLERWVELTRSLAG